MIKEEQPRWDRVEQASLSDEHGQRNTFPGDGFVALIIKKLEGAKNLEAGETAVEKKTSYAKGTAPAIKGVEGGQWSDETGPNKTADQVEVETVGQTIKQIDPGRIS